MLGLSGNLHSAWTYLHVLLEGGDASVHWRTSLDKNDDLAGLADGQHERLDLHKRRCIQLSESPHKAERQKLRLWAVPTTYILEACQWQITLGLCALHREVNLSMAKKRAVRNLQDQMTLVWVGIPSRESGCTLRWENPYRQYSRPGFDP